MPGRGAEGQEPPASFGGFLDLLDAHAAPPGAAGAGTTGAASTTGAAGAGAAGAGAAGAGPSARGVVPALGGGRLGGAAASGRRGGSRAGGAGMYAFDWASGFVAPFLRTGEGTTARLARALSLGPADTVVDLGCGDGCVLVALSRGTGCRGVGYDLDEDLLDAGRAAAEAAGVGGRVAFARADILSLVGQGGALAGARVAFLFMLPSPLRAMAGGLVRAMDAAPGLCVVTNQWPLPLPAGREPLLVGRLPGRRAGGGGAGGDGGAANDLWFYAGDAARSAVRDAAALAEGLAGLEGSGLVQGSPHP